MGGPGGGSWDHPGKWVPRGLAAPMGMGGFTLAPWQCLPTRTEAGEQPAGASGFPALPAQGPGAAACEGQVWNQGQRTGGGAGGSGRRGRYLDFTSQSQGGEQAWRQPCLPGDAPELVLILSLHSGWVPSASPVGPCRAAATRHWPRCLHRHFWLVFPCHTREVYLFLQHLREDLKGND